MMNFRPSGGLAADPGSMVNDTNKKNIQCFYRKRHFTMEESFLRRRRLVRIIERRKTIITYWVKFVQCCLDLVNRRPATANRGGFSQCRETAFATEATIRISLQPESSEDNPMRSGYFVKNKNKCGLFLFHPESLTRMATA